MGVEESGGVGSECGKSPGRGRKTSAGAAEEARSELGRVELGGVYWSVSHPIEEWRGTKGKRLSKKGVYVATKHVHEVVRDVELPVPP